MKPEEHKPEQPHNNYGSGRVTFKDGRAHYQGTFPFREDSDVVLMTRENFDLLLQGCHQLLFESRAEMPLQQANDFPDRLEYQDNKGNSHQLLLDRHYYATDATKMIVVRYASLDEQLDEKEDWETDEPR